MSTSEWWRLGALVFIALLVRGWYAWWQGLLLTPDSWGDYLPLARQIAAEGRYDERWPDGEWRPTCYRTPGYPAFLAVFYKEGEIRLSAVLGMQVLLSGLTVGLTYLLGLALADRRTAWGAAWVQTFSPFMIPAVAMILVEALLGFVLALGWVFLTRRGLRYWVLSGGLFGYACLIKPTGLLVLLVLAVSGLWTRTWRKSVLVALGTALLVITPWSYRCTKIYGRFMLLPSIGYGAGIYHAAVADGGCIGWMQEGGTQDCQVLEAKFVKLKRGLDEIRADSVVGAVGFARIWSDPVAWLRRRIFAYPRLVFHNGDYFLRGHAQSFLTAWKARDGLVLLIKALAWTESLLIALGLSMGLIASWQHKRDIFMLIGIPLLAVLAAHLPMWIETRYFMPFLPFAHILAVYGWQQALSGRLLYGRIGGKA